jgi:hypothetical protein
MLSLGLAWKAGVPGLENAGDSIKLALGGGQGASIRLPASFAGFLGLSGFPECLVTSDALWDFLSGVSY